MVNNMFSKEVFIIIEFVHKHSEMFIVFYGVIILWINIDYLRDHKNIKKELKKLPADSEEKMLLDPASFSVILLRIAFDFIRRWFIYILATAITESTLVLIISIILFIVSLYDILFNYSLARVANSSISFYLILIDTVIISIFIIYLFNYHIA